MYHSTCCLQPPVRVHASQLPNAVASTRYKKVTCYPVNSSNSICCLQQHLLFAELQGPTSKSKTTCRSQTTSSSRNTCCLQNSNRCARLSAGQRTSCDPGITPASVKPQPAMSTAQASTPAASSNGISLQNSRQEASKLLSNTSGGSWNLQTKMQVCLVHQHTYTVARLGLAVLGSVSAACVWQCCCFQQWHQFSALQAQAVKAAQVHQWRGFGTCKCM